MQHSKIVGGSTAKRVINCPGSVALVAKMPPQPESKYAAEGTLLHACVEDLLNDGELGDIIAKHGLMPEQGEKLQFCLGALDEIDPEQKMVFAQEVEVQFPYEGVFGHVDLIGRLGDEVIILDWKFGDGVIVEAEENEQGLFYAAAAMNTPSLNWVFDGAKTISIVIVQPFQTRRWNTTFARVAQFQADLLRAIHLSQAPAAPLAVGDHCRWCAAKPVCPQMTGAVDRVTHQALKDISSEQLGQALELASRLESFIADARALALMRLEKGIPVPGFKLVAKRAVRQWTNEAEAAAALQALGVSPYKQEVISPAQAEKELKKSKQALPDLVVAVSSGNTIAEESDPRPAVLVIGEQLKAALSRVN